MLKTSEVYKCLDKKTLIFGFEMLDLFLVFSVLAVLNFVLSGVQWKFAFTWGPALSLAAFLRLSKTGKPENYLLHFLKYYSSPGVLECFTQAKPRRYFITKSNRE